MARYLSLLEDFNTAIGVTVSGRPARRVARDRNVRISGAIGGLIYVVDAGELHESTASTWLKRLVDQTDYRTPS